MSGLDVREVSGRYGTAIAGLALVLFFLLFAPNCASTMNIINVQPVLSGTLTCVATNGCGATTTQSFPVATSPCSLPCGPIDFNGNGVYPEDADIIDFFSVLAGGACPTGNCADIDFNGNTVFPEDADVIAFFRVLAGGPCN